MSSTTKQIHLSVVRTDGGTQMREEIDKETYLDYRDKMKAGVKFPAIDVFCDGSTYWLADGFHRFYGAREGNLDTILANVHKGTVRDAILYAAGSNADHGLKRSSADKRNAVLALLKDPDWGKRSSNWIADACRVSNSTVESYRREFAPLQSQTCALQERVGKDGKSYSVKKSQSAPATQEAEPVSEPHIHASERKPVVDSLGKPVPATLVDVFAECQKWEQAMNFVSQAKEAVTEIQGHRAAMHLDIQELERLLAQSRTLLKFAAPYTECCKCRRKVKDDCPHCRGQGWLNKARFTACASDDDKWWLEARALVASEEVVSANTEVLK